MHCRCSRLPCPSLVRPSYLGQRGEHGRRAGAQLRDRVPLKVILEVGR